MKMAYKILYIDDQDTASRKADFEELGFEVITHDPTNDFKEIELKVKDGINALILDYKLTEGTGEQACFDAPTIAQFVRTMHSVDGFNIPIVLMSNQINFTDYYNNDYTSQDLFDFTITKQDFVSNKEIFGQKLNSFISAYQKIKSDNNLSKSLGIDESKIILHSRFISDYEKLNNNHFKISSLIYDDLLCSVGITIGIDALSARLGISQDSDNWPQVLESLKTASYTGVFSDIKQRWWMDKVNKWWNDSISSDTSIRRLNAEERVELLKSKLGLENLIPLTKTKHSLSSNFWTVCKFSKKALDPFDGIELLKDYLPWQEKEYISIDSALAGQMEVYKNQISAIDKKAIRELVKNERANG
ncbi:conserved hypothetical protein [Tenacibaculum maritimum]|nr:conserved hypothetical protein [Tenacibaculum maritimum]CAA0213860.1 conserved hypothetical protein [Tenacibaculum maritimum]